MIFSKLNDRVLIFVLLLYVCNIFNKGKSQQEKLTSYKNVSCEETLFTLFCDCQNENEYMILPQLYGYGYFNRIEISNCKHMTVRANALENIRGLRIVVFKRVQNLILTENALSFPIQMSTIPLIVHFKEVKIEVIESHAINGNIRVITFAGTTIETIRPFAFMTLDEMFFFKMNGVTVNSIALLAFKKISTDHFVIVNCEFLSELPSKTFDELKVLSTLRIQNVTFSKVHTRAFSFKVVKKLFVIDNKFERTEGEWITAQIRNKALIKGNDFGITSPVAFKAIEISNKLIFMDDAELHFINNTVQFPNEPQPLIFNDKIQLHITHLQYHNNFPCRELEKNQPKTPFYRSYTDSIYFETKSNNQSSALSQIIDSDCKEKSYLLYIILGVVGLVLILIIIAAIIITRIINKRKKRKLNVVLPESRTYKEIQIIYQIVNVVMEETESL